METHFMAQIATALVAAQSEFRDPQKDATNPHFRSRFVTLKGVLDAVRPVLHKYGLAIVQEIDFEDGITFVRTMLLHKGGSSIESRCPVVCAKQNDPQALGSAITYARRYSAAAICGIAPADEDDDGEDASPRPAAIAAAPRSAHPAQPFVFFEEAKDAIAGSTTVDALTAIGARIAASTFGPTEKATLKELWAARKKDL